MAGVQSDQGIKDRLDSYCTGILSGIAKLRLFSNNTNNGTSAVLGDFTECTFTGYAAVTMGTYPGSTVAAHVASSSPPAITFTITAGTQNVYGWYKTNAAGTRLLDYQRDPAPPTLLDSTGINTYTVTAVETYQDIST